MEFCEEYPLRPPRIKFLSKMFHPNINAYGEIFLDILREKQVVNVIALVLILKLSLCF